MFTEDGESCGNHGNVINSRAHRDDSTMANDSWKDVRSMAGGEQWGAWDVKERKYGVCSGSRLSAVCALVRIMISVILCKHDQLRLCDVVTQNIPTSPLPC